MVFFRKYLCDRIAQEASTSVIAPLMLTINDLFSKANGVNAADRVRLLVDLYACYKDLNPKAESLDEFIL